MKQYPATKLPAVLESTTPLSQEQAMLIEQLYTDGIKSAFRDAFELALSSGAITLAPNINKAAALLTYCEKGLNQMRSLPPIVIRVSDEILSKIGALNAPV